MGGGLLPSSELHQKRILSDAEKFACVLGKGLESLLTFMAYTKGCSMRL